MLQYFIILLFLILLTPLATAAPVASQQLPTQRETISELSLKDKQVYEAFQNQYQQALAQDFARLWYYQIEKFLAENHAFAQRHTHLIEIWVSRAKAAQLINDSVFGTEASLILKNNQALFEDKTETIELLKQLDGMGWIDKTRTNNLQEQVTLKVIAYNQLEKPEERQVIDADQGNARSKGHLGELYLTGRLVSKNDNKALYWLRKAAELGDNQAQHNLGYMYMTGRAVPKNLEQALYWYQKAADQGNTMALNKIGYLYTHGRGLSKDPQKAISLFQQGAENGNILAQYNLADMYFYGRGIPKDFQKAFYWYTKAAEQGDALAQLNLGYLYQFGKGTSKNEQKALYWYQRSADQGNSMAKNNLEQMLKWYDGK